jgi:hypothetical protein
MTFGSNGATAAVFNLMPDSDPPDPTDPFPGLVKAVSYFFEVCAYRAVPPDYGLYSGRCRSSTVRAVDVSGPPVSLVKNPLVYQALAIGLTWAAPSDTGAGSSFPEPAVLQYEVQLSADSEFTSVYTNRTTTTVSAVLASLPKGATFYCRVRAVTVAGRGNFSSVIGPLTVQGLSTAPRDLALISGRDSSGLFVSASWNLPSDTGDLTNLEVPVTSYAIDFSNHSDFSFGVVSFTTSTNQFDSRFTGTSQASQTMKTLVQTNQGNLLYCRVSARTVYGLGAVSNTASRTIVAAPGAPTQAVMRVSGPLQLNLSWVPPADKGAGVGKTYPLTQYLIYVYQGPSSTSPYDSVTVDGSATFVILSSFQSSSLSRGSLYSASVWSVNDVGQSSTASAAQQTAVGLSSAPEQVILCSYETGSSCSLTSSAGGSVSASGFAPAGPLSLW